MTGTSWADAYQTFDDLHDNNNNALEYDIYVKARENSPARLGFLNPGGGFANKNFFYNATGTGTELSSRRGLYFGSEQLDISSATLHSGTVYKVSFAGNTRIELSQASTAGVWHCLNGSMDNEFYYHDEDITALIGASPYDNTSIAVGRYFYDDVADEMYFNIGRAPTSGDYLEVVNESVVEIYDGMDMTGGIFRFGHMGQDNGTCSGVKVFDCDFSWNQLFGFDTAPNPNDAAGGPLIVEACTINNNGSGGVNITNTGQGCEVRFCTIMGNGTFGYRNRGTFVTDGCSILNCTVTGNGTGVIAGSGATVCQTSIYNNIIWDNTTDLDIVDNANNTALYDYNAVETFTGKAAQQDNDVTTDPGLLADGRIPPGSSAYDKGRTNLYSEAVYDIRLRQVTQSDGTLYGVMSLGANTLAALEIKTWRGAVEPAGAGGTGNEIKLWRGAVEPTYTAPAVESATPATNKGGLTKKQRRKRQRLMVEIDNQFIEVSSQEEALQLFERAREATEEAIEQEVPIKNTKPVRVRVTSQGPEPVPLDLEKEAKKYQKTLNKALKQAREKQAALTDKKAEIAAKQLAKDADKKLRTDVQSLKRRVRDLEDLIAILARL